MSKTYKECLASEGVTVLDLNAADYAKLAADAIMKAYRETKKVHVLVPKVMDQKKLAEIESYCAPELDFLIMTAEGITGTNSISSLNALLDNTVAAVYFEDPVAPGLRESNATAIISASRHSCAQVIIGVGPEVER